MRAPVVLCALAICTVALGPASGCAADRAAAPPPVQASTPTPTAGPSTASPSITGPSTPSPSTASPSRSVAPERVQGIDVSAYQREVDWPRWRRSGVRFVWIKASEGTTWTNRYFTDQRDGARSVGMYQGAYHYARPANSSGRAQARHFVASGGGWTDDGQSLPGALDLEKNPNGPACYGKSAQRMVAGSATSPPPTASSPDAMR